MSRKDNDENGNSESEKRLVEAVGLSRVDLYWRKYLRDREKNGVRDDLVKEYRRLLEGVKSCMSRLKHRIGAIESFTYGEEEAVRSEVRWDVKKVLETHLHLEERLVELLNWIDTHAILD